VLLTIKLCRHALFEKIVLIQLEKDVLSDIGLEFGCRTAKYVEADIEPPVNRSMNGMIFVAKCLRRALLDYGSCFRCRSVLIGT